MKHCPTCRRTLPERPVIEDQSRNGVRVIVRRWLSGTTVEADCSCFGGRRAHSNPECPWLRANRI